MTASQTSSALSSDSDVPKMLGTIRKFRKNEAMTSDSTVLPFCRLTMNSTVRYLNDHRPPRSPTISSAWISAHSCHG